MANVDIRILQDDSMIGFKPVSDEGSDWVHENVHSEPWQWLGGTLWVDYRMADAVLHGITEAGLEVAQ